MAERRPSRRPTEADWFAADIEKLAAEKAVLEADLELRRAELRSVADEETEALGSAQKTRSILFVGPVVDATVAGLVASLKKLRAYSTEPITVEFNSNGGFVTEGFALIDYMRKLQRDGVHLTVEVYGEAASMAAVILQLADRRIVGKHAFLMVHEPSAGSEGRLSEMAEQHAFARRQQDILLDILASKASVSRATIKRRWLKRDWWLSADEAVAAGLADEVL